MSTELTQESFSAPVELGVADKVIAGLAKRLDGATAETPKKYEIVRKGIAECRGLRKQVDNAHKELKARALAWGRACDSEKKRVLELIAAVEEPLKREKEEVDNAKELARKAKLEAARAEQKAKEAAERERIQDEQAAERAKLAAERKKLDAEKAEAQRKQREAEDKLAEERRKLDAEREKVAEEKRAREAEDKRRLEAIEAERRAQKESEQAAEREMQAAILREERKPDAEKLFELGVALSEYKLPDVKTEWAQKIVAGAYDGLVEISNRIAKQIELMR